MTLSRPRLIGSALILSVVCAAIAFAVSGAATASNSSVATSGTTAGAPSPQTLSRLAFVESELTGQCMARAGFRFVPVRKAVKASGPTADFGSDDVLWASRHGYGLTAVTGQNGTRNDPNVRIYEALSPAQQAAYRAALDGSDASRIVVAVPGVGDAFTNTDGCQSSAREQLYGDLGVWGRVHTLATNLPALTYPRVVADPRFLDRQSEWRRCMDRDGLRFADSAAAAQWADRAYRRHPRAVAAAIERRTAVADARCSASTQLIAVARQLDTAYRAQVEAEHRADLTRYRHLVAVALDRAARI